MKQVYLLGAGFTKALVGDKAPLTDELMEKLDISKFPEIHDDFINSSGIEVFISLLDLKIINASRINNSLAERLQEIRKDIIDQIVQLFSPEKINGKFTPGTLAEKFIIGSEIFSTSHFCVFWEGGLVSTG